MKKIKKASLFFVVCMVVCFGTNSLYSQQAIDSSLYYSSQIQTSKTNEDLSRAFEYFQEKKNTDLSKNYTYGVVYDLTNMAFAERRMGFLNESENSAVEALMLLDEIEDKETAITYKVPLYNHLGILYKELKDYESAIGFYEKVAEAKSTSEDRVTLFNNMGNVYKEQGKFEKAIAYYEIAYDSSLKHNNKVKTSRALDNLGFAQSKLQQAEGFNNMMVALDIRLQKQNGEGIFISYMHLADYYKDVMDEENTLVFTRKALSLARETKKIKFIENALALKMRLKEDPEVLDFMVLNDSISEATRLASKKYSAIKYNYNKKERELLESELERERVQVYSISFVLFLFALGASIYFFLKTRHKKDTLEQIYKTEVLISKRVHDEVANDVYHFMTKFQTSPTINEAFLDDLEAIYNKTRDISKQNSEIDVNEAFGQLLSDLLLSFRSNEINIIAKDLSKVNWEVFSKEKKIIIYRVLQELMVNMKKHSQANIVVISFLNTKEKLVIDYKDNGIGSDLKTRNGLRNVENRIHSIKGNITFSSGINEGFRAQIKV